MVLVLMLVSSIAWSQSRTVSGKVTSAEDGSPIPGVNVVQKGTTNGTSTDANGAFSLSISDASATLVFSFIGLRTQEVEVANKTVIDVPMTSDITQLSEVVVTGYATQTKREITGSISSVKGQVFESLPMQTFDRAIQGRAAGVQVTSGGGQPGSGVTVNIRGTGTISGTTQPLYIIDGVQLTPGTLNGVSSSNALSSINPADIENIEILKDAAAASIYGALAGNGVVIITTKKGKSGAAKVKASVQYGISQQYNPYKVLNADQWLSLKEEAFGNQAVRQGNTYQSGVNQAKTLYDYDGDPNTPNQSTDWVRAILRTGKIKQYDISLSGGDEKTKFFISGSLNNTEGTIIASSFMRGTLRANLEHKINKIFSLEASLSLTGSDTQGPSANQGFFVNTPFTGALFVSPYSPIYNPDGTYNTTNIVGSSSFNIVQLVTQEKRKSGTFQTVSNLAFNAQIIPGLRFRAFAGVDFSDVKDYNYRPASIPGYAPGTGSETFRRNPNWNTNYTLTYNKKLNDIHNIGVVAGYEYREVNQTTLGSATQGFANPAFTLLSSGATPTSATSTFTGYKLAGVFANLKYDYKDKYLASATIRYDGSSRFGASNRYGAFYGLSAGWRMKSEDFMSNVNFIDDLKIRGSYGVVGVQPQITATATQNSDFLSLSLYGNGNQYNGLGGIRPVQLANGALSWEQAATLDFGLDFAIWGSRISGSVDFWKKNNTGILLPRQLPADSGFPNIYKNGGEIENKGIDFELTSVNVNNGGFKWSTSFNITFIQNKLLSLYDGLTVSTISGQRYVVGQPLNILYTYKYAGVNPADGRPMYYDINGNTTYSPKTTDQQIIGSQNPKFYGGFANSFSYKGFSLEVFFNYQYGNNAFLQAAQILEAEGSGLDNQNINQLSRWTTPGQITGVPRAYQGATEPGGFNPTNLSSRYIQTASYIRLKQVTLNYRVPSTIASRMKMSGLNLFVQAINLATFTNYRGDDPEQATSNNLNAYPNPKSITGGITIEF
ncbi:SusC/RagA family TonB-linked outer membrane protein [Cytophagales bacterium WSM2-2]|nr:SusC/RagA family TonB-linked outer membrane protein [Cytophagales bacterium WSM2-2]